jgi:hypothetical protein
MDDQVKAEPLGAVVDRWFSDHFPGSVVARNVDAYNYVHSAVEELKRRLHTAPATVGDPTPQKPLSPVKPAPTTSPPKPTVVAAPAPAAPIKNEPAAQ